MVKSVSNAEVQKFEGQTIHMIWNFEIAVPFVELV